MPKWEYKVVDVRMNNVAMEALLNALGADGWEFAGADSTGETVILKRPLPDA